MTPKSALVFSNSKKEKIEQELGHMLEWEKLPTARDSRISSYLRNVNPDDESDWPRQHEWIVKHLNEMHRVFSQRVRDL